MTVDCAVFGELCLHVTVRPTGAPSGGMQLAVIGEEAGGSIAYVGRQLAALGRTVRGAVATGADGAGTRALELFGQDGFQVVRDGTTARVLVLLEPGGTRLLADGGSVDVGPLARHAHLATGAAYTHLSCFPGSDPLRLALVRAGARLVADFGYLPWLTDVGTMAREVLGRLAGVRVLILNGGHAPGTVQLGRRCVADGVPLVLTTLGADGVVVIDADGQRHLPAGPVVVRNPVGAGDTFVAGLLDALLAGRSADDAAAWGQRVAGTKIGKDTGPALREELCG